MMTVFTCRSLGFILDTGFFMPTAMFAVSIREDEKGIYVIRMMRREKKGKMKKRPHHRHILALMRGGT